MMNIALPFPVTHRLHSSDQHTPTSRISKAPSTTAQADAKVKHAVFCNSPSALQTNMHSMHPLQTPYSHVWQFTTTHAGALSTNQTFCVFSAAFNAPQCCLPAAKDETLMDQNTDQPQRPQQCIQHEDVFSRPYEQSALHQANLDGMPARCISSWGLPETYRCSPQLSFSWLSTSSGGHSVKLTLHTRPASTKCACNTPRPS